MEQSKVDEKEVEVCIVEGGAKLSFKLPVEMDLITAKGVVQQVSNFIKLLDKTQTFAPQKSQTYNIMSEEEKKEFLNYYDNNGLEKTMAKYGFNEKSQVYSRVYSYRKALTRDTPLDDDIMLDDENTEIINMKEEK